MTPASKTLKLTPRTSATPKYTQMTLTRAGTPRNTLMYSNANHDHGRPAILTIGEQQATDGRDQQSDQRDLQCRQQARHQVARGTPR